MSIQLYDRRELLRVGGLTLGGLGLADLVKASPQPTQRGSSFGRAKNIIFLYLCGGPPQHETFDPKPDAPVEIRGPFNPIQTNIPGIQFSELLPRTAGIADKLAVIRSMSTDDNIHSSSGHWVLTGYKYQGPNARTIQKSDWPFYGSIIKRYKPSSKMPGLSSGFRGCEQHRKNSQDDAATMPVRGWRRVLLCFGVSLVNARRREPRRSSSQN